MQKVSKNSRQSLKKSDNFWGKYPSRTMSTICILSCNENPETGCCNPSIVLLYQVLDGLIREEEGISRWLNWVKKKKVQISDQGDDPVQHYLTGPTNPALSNRIEDQ